MMNINTKTLLNYQLATLFIFMLLPGCLFGAPTLQESIKIYYDSEKRGDWAKVYSLRTSNFKNSVSENEFVAEMKEAAQGWVLLKYEVDDILLNGDLAEVKIAFLEKPPAEYWAGSGMQASNLSVKMYSMWIKEDNVWRCKETPSRSYLPYSK